MLFNNTYHSHTHKEFSPVKIFNATLKKLILHADTISQAVQTLASVIEYCLY